ncbi:hypothetical protein [Corynebacterium lizhenjunii]|uniref:hypothetical protein n=1 Tax=Corynebacterium lizhenjunii TaxID=2709394 RepID=UPI0013ED6AB7|nr:hypothetical protein [Corynebacterium lizhenjunii]
MDLSTIQMHLDNFATTWTNWGKIFNTITDVWMNVIKATNFLSSENAGTAAGWFPNTANDVAVNKATN